MSCSVRMWQRRATAAWKPALTVALIGSLLVGNLPMRVAYQLALPIAAHFSEVAAAASAASTTRVSVNTAGAPGTLDSESSIQNMSADGRYVVFRSASPGFPSANGWQQVYVRDRNLNTTTLVSVNSAGTGGGNSNSGEDHNAQISSDGRYVSFISSATNLVASDTNGFRDVFVRDLQLNTTVLVTKSTGGTLENADVIGSRLAAGGGFVVFSTNATNLVSVCSCGGTFLRDLAAGTTVRIAENADGSGVSGSMPSISPDGRYVAFQSAGKNFVLGVTSNSPQIYRLDRTGGSWVLVTAGDGTGGDDESDFPSVATEGSVVFITNASNLGLGADHLTKLVRMGGGFLTFIANIGFAEPYLSPDGRFVVFWYSNQAFIFDSATSAIEVVSVSNTGEVSNGQTESGSVSDDGHYVSFLSFATNLVPGKANPTPTAADVFVRDRGDQDVGAAFPYTFGNAPHRVLSRDPINLATGVFTSEATDLAIPGRLLGFAFTRYYNSADTMNGPLGGAWTHSYNWRAMDAGSFIDVRRGDGRRDRFARQTNGTYLAPPSVFDSLVKNANKTFTLTLTNQVVYDFGTNGALTKISEPAGNQMLLTYASGNLTSITDSVGRVVTLGYDASNRVNLLQDGLGRKVTYAYDGSGRLSTVTDKIGNAAGQNPALHRWTYGYSGTTLHLTTITDPDGRVRVTNTYDAQGRVYQQRDGKNALTTFDYSIPGQTVETDPRGHATTYAFDGRGRMLTQTDVVGASTYVLSNTYDTAGNRSRTVDRNGGITDYTFDARGNILTKTDPQIDLLLPRYVTQFSYDAKNNLTQITDARLFTTTTTYHATSNVILSVSRQIDATTFAIRKWEYADAVNPGMPTRVITPRGNTGSNPDYAYATTLTYDAQANLVTQVDADGAQTTWAYDAVGRMTSNVDPDGYSAGSVAADHTWTLTSDENDRQTKRTDPLGNTLQTAYDGAGNATSVTDRRAGVTTYSYDANARLTSVQQKPDPVGSPTLVYATTAGLDGNGNATSVTQGNGVVTDYAFDAIDRMTSVTTHPDAQTNLTTSVTLDGIGQTLTRTTPDSIVTTFGRDALSRLTSVAATGLTTISYEYDALSQRTRLVDGTGSTTYQYDGLGRMTQVAAPGGTVNYGYDLDSNRTLLQYPSTQAVTYAYTAGGRLDHLNDWAGRLSTYTYRRSGLVDTVVYPDGMRALYGYDRAQRLTSLANLVGTTVVNREVYGLDGEGNRTVIDEVVQGITAAPSTTWAASVKVNSDTGTTVQDHPAIALGNEGPAAAAYLVWDDARNGNADIFFARRDPATGVWGTNTKINTDTGTRIQQNPAVSTDGASNAYAVWQDERNGAGKADIYYAKRTATTGAWSTPNLKVSDDPGASGGAVQRNPRLAGTAAGAQTAVWVDLRSSQQNIYSSQLTVGGSAWAVNKRVTDNTAAVKDFPDVTVGADGTTYAVWQDSRSGNADIYFAKLSAGASAWSANIKISDDPGTAVQRLPRIGIDAGGTLTAVWLDDRSTPSKIRMSRLPAGSSTWSASTIVTDAAARPVSTALAVRADGKAYVAFQDSRGTSNDVYGTEYDPWLASWSTSALISDDPGAALQQTPAIAYSTSELIGTWRDDRAGNANVQALRATLTGTDHMAYTYDGLTRLTAVTGAQPESFTLDGASNITARTGPTHTYTYDNANRASKLDGSAFYTWSGADRQTNRGADVFGFDPLSRLTSSTVAGTARAYAYNGDGFLQSITQGGTTNYLWSGEALLLAGGDMVVSGLGPLYAVRPDATTYSLARDGLGSVRAEVSDGGTATKSFRYTAAGEIGTSVGGTPTSFGFVGELRDSSGLIYLRARWYDPSNGRFISRDPSNGAPVNPASLNGFNYANGNPANLTDPSGLEPGGHTTAGSVGGFLYGVGATRARGPGGVTIINNASGGLLGTIVGIPGKRNTITFSATLIVSRINLGNDPTRETTLLHEYGHIPQANALGVLYLPAYVALYVPALVDLILLEKYLHQPVGFHDVHLMELDANARQDLPLFSDYGKATQGR